MAVIREPENGLSDKPHRPALVAAIVDTILMAGVVFLVCAALDLWLGK